MTLMLTLPTDLEQRLMVAAEENGVSTDDYLLQMLFLHLPSRDKYAEAVLLLKSWTQDECEEEQKTTGETLVTALDEDRPTERKLFPPELRGVTW